MCVLLSSDFQMTKNIMCALHLSHVIDKFDRVEL